MENASPLRPTDDAARALAARLVGEARLAALALVDPADGSPHVTRIAFAHDSEAGYLTLVSDLAAHSRLLRAAPRAALLLGEAPDKGDPLAFPRLSLSATAQFIDRDSAGHSAARPLWLARHPKSALYVDFADFHFVRFTPLSADLNGGFGKAYRLTPTDLPA